MVMQPDKSASASELELFLEAPEKLLQQSVEFQLEVANNCDTPRNLLSVLANSQDEQVAEAVRLHVNWAGEITGDWRQVVDDILQSRQLGQNDRLAVELLKLGPIPPCFLSEWVSAERLIQGLQNPHIPLRYRLQLLGRLAVEPTLETQLFVAESPETPRHILEQFAGDLELAVRLAVKFNPSSQRTLIELVEGQHAVASNWNTDAEQLLILGQSRWAWIRLAVAQNPQAPQDTLMQLARDNVYKIQLAVAKNPITAASALAILAEHEDVRVQAAVVEHENATETIMHQLFPSHQGVLKGRKNLPSSILERFFNERATDKPAWKDSNLRYFLLNQPNTPTWILAELANVDLEALRAEKQANNKVDDAQAFEKSVLSQISFLADIVKHPQVDIDILEDLAKSPNPDAQIAVAQNSLTPTELKLDLLENLAVYPDEKIQAKVAAHPETPINVLEAMASEQLYHARLTRELRRVLTSEYPANACSYKATSDRIMSDIKHNILYPNGVSIDIERWIEMIECLDMLENANSYEGIVDEFDLPDEFGESPFESDSNIIVLISFWQEVLPELSEKLLKQFIGSILEILALIKKNSEAHFRSVAVALVGNSNTPANLRKELKNQLIRPSVPLDHPNSDYDLFSALIYNPDTPEEERQEYFEQLLYYVSTRRKMARNPRTPQNILEQICKQGEKLEVAENPATSEHLLRKLANETQPHDYLWRAIAKNPNAPADLLIQFVNQLHDNKTISNVSMLDLVVANPKLPILERYRLLLAKEEAEETAKAHKLMARRSDSSYALAQVLEKGDEKSKLIAARSNKTPIHVLEQLAKDSSEVVRQVVLQNSNLPLDNLLELAQDKSINIRLNLLYKSTHQKTEVSLQLLEILAIDESEQVRAKVAEHPDITIKLLVQLAGDTNREVKRAVVKNIKTPIPILERLGLEENICDFGNPNTPGTVLAQAITATTGHRSNEILLNLIKRSKRTKGTQLPADVLDELSYSSNSELRIEVADHPNTSVSTLRCLSNDEHFYVRLQVAQNLNTPPDIVEQIVRYQDPNVNKDYYTLCNYVSQRPDTTASLLESLSNSQKSYIRCMIANNDNTTLSTLTQMVARENDEFVLQKLANNYKLTPPLLLALAQKPYLSIRLILIKHSNMTLELWEHLAKDESVELRQKIASQSNCPIVVLESLATDRDENVRLEVAGNLNTPVSVLENLARDENLTVRTATAANPNVFITVLAQLANDEKLEVRRAVALNPNTPVPIRENLHDLVAQPVTKQTISPTLRALSRLYNPDTDDLPSILTEYAQSENAFVRFVTLMNPQTPGEILTQAAQSISWLERYAVAENPSVPEATRLSLSQDSNRIVRAAARES